MAADFVAVSNNNRITTENGENRRAIYRVRGIERDI